MKPVLTSFEDHPLAKQSTFAKLEYLRHPLDAGQTSGIVEAPDADAAIKKAVEELEIKFDPKRLIAVRRA